MKDVKVSVVMPVYNSERFLGQCIDSLLLQSLKEIEIICVDDGSTDGSLGVLESYSKLDERVVVIHQENAHAGIARNKGFELVKGEYVIFLDSDDFFETDMLQEMYQRAKLVDADICLCGGRIYDETDGTYKDAHYFLDTKALPIRSFFAPEEISEHIFNFTTPAPWTKLFRSEFIREQKLSFQNLQTTNDLFFVCAALVSAKRITTVSQEFVNYRSGGVTNLQANNHLSPLDFYEALKALREELYKRKIYSRYEKSYKNLVLNVCAANLNRAKSYGSFELIFLKLKNEIFYNLGLIGHFRSYFYSGGNFTLLLDVMGKTPQDVWERRLLESQKVVEEPEPLIEIENWTNSIKPSSSGGILVSVIIPVYNVEDYLRECLDSVIHQSLQDIEIICVNDGSIDFSADILREYAQLDPRIRIHAKENGGLSSARNAGLNLATGEYIYFLDSDDVIDLRTLEFLYVNAKKDDLDQLFFSAEVFWDDGVEPDFNNYQNYYVRKHDYSKLMSGRELFEKFVQFYEFKPSVPLQFMKRTFLIENNLSFMQGIIHEDQLFTMQSLAVAKRVRYANINLYKRRMRKDSIMTKSVNFNSIYSLLKIIDVMAQYVQTLSIQDDMAYFDALQVQLDRLCDSARKEIATLSSQILQEELHKLTVQEQLHFRYYFYVDINLKKNLSAERERANRLAENNTISDYKWQYKVKQLEKQLQVSQKELGKESTRRIQLENSHAFHVGCVVIALPQKIYYFFKRK